MDLSFLICKVGMASVAQSTEKTEGDHKHLAPGTCKQSHKGQQGSVSFLDL